MDLDQAVSFQTLKLTVEVILPKENSYTKHLPAVLLLLSFRHRAPRFAPPTLRHQQRRFKTPTSRRQPVTKRGQCKSLRLLSGRGKGGSWKVARNWRGRRSRWGFKSPHGKIGKVSMLGN